jgi:hypothetical protein
MAIFLFHFLEGRPPCRPMNPAALRTEAIRRTALRPSLELKERHRSFMFALASDLRRNRRVPESS